MGGYSVIALDKFIQATRDSGYKGTVSAISELVDNSIQAKASNVEITIRKVQEIEEHPIVVSVVDDGHGMDSVTLRQSLRFGGTTRFGDRHGLGRYGMGLPNASLSQARRVEVYSWRKSGAIFRSYLDVGEIVAGVMNEVPKPSSAKLPKWVEKPHTPSGTAVVWTECDRLDNRRASTIDRRIRTLLGRVYRYFLWDGIKIVVNGEAVVPLDPLFVRQPSLTSGGELFAEALEFEVRAPSSHGHGQTGKITVKFSELPVQLWHDLPNDEKRRLGISNGAGVSVVRGGREIDYGWFFLSGKRRENYDDWWRAEVSFEPVLDELFGITHTKQEIHPSDGLLEVLEPEMTNIARALNGRVRQLHLSLAAAQKSRTAEEVAKRKDAHLRDSVRVLDDPEQATLVERLKRRHPELLADSDGGRAYHIVEDDMAGTDFMWPIIESDRITVVLNPRHRFYSQLYRPLVQGESVQPQELLQRLQLLLIAASRAEAAASTAAEREAIRRFRREWSEVLELFLRP